MMEQYATLEQVLYAKEERAKEQRRLLDTCKVPLISFTLNIPGPVKNSEKYTRVHKEGIREIERVLKENNIRIVYADERDALAGREAYFCCSCSEAELKSLTVGIEQEHPLGRLFDMDVFDSQGMQISRTSTTSARRRCLICEEEAAVCVRSRAHSIEQLLEKIDNMIDSFFNNGGKHE